MEQPQAFLARLLPTRAAVVVAYKGREMPYKAQEEPEVAEQVRKAMLPQQQPELQEPLTQVAVGVVVRKHH